MTGKKAFAVLVAAIFLGLCFPAFAEEIPDYSEWEFCMSQSAAGARGKSCFDREPSFAHRLVVEYSERDTDRKTLLILGGFGRSTKHFEMRSGEKSYRIEKMTFRFYRMGESGWEYIETKTLTRKGSPVNRAIPMFKKDSLFGREFYGFMNAAGYPEAKIPTVTFQD